MGSGFSRRLGRATDWVWMEPNERPDRLIIRWTKMSNKNNKTGVDELKARITEFPSEEREELFEGLQQERLETYLEIRGAYFDELKEESIAALSESSPWVDYCEDHPEDPICGELSFGVHAPERGSSEIREKYVDELLDRGVWDVEANVLSDTFRDPLLSEGVRSHRRFGVESRPSRSAWPVNLIDWPEWDLEVPDEPDIPPPSDPFFGADACGRAAGRVYKAFRAQAPGLPRQGAYNSAARFADLCREQMPEYNGRCAGAAERGWANCYAGEYIDEESRGPSDECERAAELSAARCRRLRSMVPPPYTPPAPPRP